MCRWEKVRAGAGQRLVRPDPRRRSGRGWQPLGNAADRVNGHFFEFGATPLLSLSMLLLASVLPWLAGRLSAAVLAALGGGAPGPLGRVFRRFSGPLPALLVTSNMGTLFEQVGWCWLVTIGRLSSSCCLSAHRARMRSTHPTQPDKLVGAWITAFAQVGISSGARASGRKADALSLCCASTASSLPQELRRRPDARFVAIHIQELGGKDWAVGMASVDAFIECVDLCRASPEVRPHTNSPSHSHSLSLRQLRAQPECMYFGRALVLLDTQHDRGDSFTALGSIYLVHDEVAEAEVLDVASGRFQPLVGTVVARDLNDCFLAEKQRFADSVYPWVSVFFGLFVCVLVCLSLSLALLFAHRLAPCRELQKAWTRKGFVHVRFRLDGRLVVCEKGGRLQL